MIVLDEVSYSFASYQGDEFLDFTATVQVCFRMFISNDNQTGLGYLAVRSILHNFMSRERVGIEIMQVKKIKKSFKNYKRDETSSLQ